MADRSADALTPTAANSRSTPAWLTIRGRDQAADAITPSARRSRVARAPNEIVMPSIRGRAPASAPRRLALDTRGRFAYRRPMPTPRRSLHLPLLVVLTLACGDAGGRTDSTTQDPVTSLPGTATDASTTGGAAGTVEPPTGSHSATAGETSLAPTNTGPDTAPDTTADARILTVDSPW